MVQYNAFKKGNYKVINFKNNMGGIKMSKKKTKAEKIKSEQRKNNRQKELEELRAKAIYLQTLIKQQKLEKFKQFNIRNLKLFTNSCNFFSPFVLTAGVIVGVFKLFGGGLPFYSDDVKKYKTYKMDYQSNGYVTMNEEYRTHMWFENPLPNSSLAIYTPWEFENGQYIRFKREYDLDTLDTLDLFDAVLREDYEYIKENLQNYKEEKQIANSIDENQDNKYFFNASLYMQDKEDFLKYKEDDLQNIIITIIELLFSLGIGGVIANLRDFDYIWEIGQINRHYNLKIKSITQTKQELEKTKEKILSLSKTQGGKI